MAIPNPKRFATLLRVRTHEANQKAAVLAALQRRIYAAEVERQRMTDEQRRMFSRAAALIEERFDAQDIQRYYQYERYLARLLSENDAEIRQLRDEERERRAELDEAMVRKRIAERLDERSHDAFVAYVNKEEQKLQDEIAIGRSWRAKLNEARSL